MIGSMLVGAAPETTSLMSAASSTVQSAGDARVRSHGVETGARGDFARTLLLLAAGTELRGALESALDEDDSPTAPAGGGERWWSRSAGASGNEPGPLGGSTAGPTPRPAPDAAERAGSTVAPSRGWTARSGVPGDAPVGSPVTDAGHPLAGGSAAPVEGGRHSGEAHGRSDRVDPTSTGMPAPVRSAHPAAPELPSTAEERPVASPGGGRRPPETTAAAARAGAGESRPSPEVEPGVAGPSNGERTGPTGDAPPKNARADSGGPVASTGDVWADRVEPERLHPELRRKVERVAARMASEFGYSVEVVEGYRSQGRQDRLYAQGRSSPGPVVTWTRASEHTRGRAVDVRVNGSWDDPRAYARLQALAREEGLTTLGPRDPGHLELPSRPGRGRPTAAGEAPSPGRWAPPPVRSEAPTRASEPAVPAPAARVASPAAVARPAPVPSPGGPARRAGESGREAPRPADAGPGGRGEATGTGRGEPSGGARRAPAETFRAPAPPPPPAATEGSGRNDGPRPRTSSQPARPEGGSAGERSSRAPDPTVAVGGRSGSGGPQAAPPSTVEAVTGAPDAASRADAVRELQEAGRPAGARVHLDVPDLDGDGTRLRMRLRGNHLDATLHMEDPSRARRVASRVDELHRALERRGLEPDALRVRLSENGGEPRPAQASGTSAGSTSGSRAEDGAGERFRERFDHEDAQRRQRERSPRDRNQERRES